MPQILRLRELGGSVSVSAVVSAMGALPSQNAFELLAEDAGTPLQATPLQALSKGTAILGQCEISVEEVLHFDVTL